jgi:hypothetical protein
LSEHQAKCKQPNCWCKTQGKPTIIIKHQHRPPIQGGDAWRREFAQFEWWLRKNKIRVTDLDHLSALQDCNRRYQEALILQEPATRAIVEQTYAAELQWIEACYEPNRQRDSTTSLPGDPARDSSQPIE